jgi:hypothetical protein
MQGGDGAAALVAAPRPFRAARCRRSAAGWTLLVQGLDLHVRPRASCCRASASCPRRGSTT